MKWMTPAVVVEFDYGMIDSTHRFWFLGPRNQGSDTAGAILAFSCTIDFNATGT